MGKFFEQLATKLADRWATLLLLPSALLAAATAIGVQLGHRQALDPQALRRAVATIWGAVAVQPPATQAVLALAFLLAAAGAGLAVQALAGVTRLVWLGRWPAPLRPVARWRAGRRRARWHRHVRQRREMERAHPREYRTADEQLSVDRAADRVNRLALAEPGRPTWMGDRMHALERVAQDRYGLDLAFAWPRLWLVLPDNTRAEIAAAHAAFAAAVATGTWAWPYLVLGALWWPALLLAAGIGVTGWVQARSATTDLTALSEAALDLHGRTLAIELGAAGPDTSGPLTVDEGARITALVRKGR
ncbi:hypothetical protein A8924_3249 [Saccharopolyspora erythraea NRRL 2338]|uniref:Uncharacterized protein n=2 Tax=Saccharopolyspora erythraea TaxID=1836 RepID=A4FDL1_SACEN|nr:hypothetical protein [Saccharopolyspora erythraea]EQD81511.1 hypothetical protein N599_35795 [Saccharopolyspora erythraea D]PFG95870.1 hypothetical protein A8924_3249 [Saccharopolyspora erythraea NRRL 2338]QRK92448.1 hypothetical protein JQX30_14720 [Saccharopolyspora erythraea]CAM02136.1 hypothetical protein SACE_2857 [Saccharopolyspora erythraea NRRL 2338]